jgi:DNA-directed RNA polymerase specialized sigma24 family protein
MDFGSFYASSKDQVYRAILLATRRCDHAEDAVADAFMRACERWETLATHPNPTAWVVRTAMNRFIKWLASLAPRSGRIWVVWSNENISAVSVRGTLSDGLSSRKTLACTPSSRSQANSSRHATCGLGTKRPQPPMEDQACF